MLELNKVLLKTSKNFARIGFFKFQNAKRDSMVCH